jgi:GNAT superfamily N-acetyltransferase
VNHADAVRDFTTRLAIQQSRRVVDVAGGIAVLHPDYPISHEHNRLLLHEAVPFEIARAEADRVLGAAGLAHRRIDWLGQAPPLPDEPGWDVARSVLMHVPGNLAPDSGTRSRRPVARVEVAPFEEIREVLRQDWLGWITDLPPSGADQLADRRRATAAACDLTFYVVRVDGRPVSRCELRVLELADGTTAAQIEEVATEAAHQGKGYARAVVAHAVRAARDAGAGLVWLEADRDERPRGLYSRMGFVTLDGELVTATHTG